MRNDTPKEAQFTPKGQKTVNPDSKPSSTYMKGRGIVTESTAAIPINAGIVFIFRFSYN